eukprot:TRINITY_DN395_c0_g1_i2.p2 TRINITY_DN395_c0_g1~~TRINITY_DN395_c0_g1_i2.p2  ORF type:complete len:179 (+),score=50.66 TRINITY_DN395_c0_g1_i2:32-568(+)
MGLLNLLRKLKRSEKEPRFLILGLDNAGKTTFLRRLSDEDPSNTSPTQGFNIKSVQREGFKLNLWDIGGQKAIRSYWANYFDETDLLIWVVDSSDKKRLEETGTELTALLAEDKLQNVPLLVLANKQDLAEALTPAEVSEALQLPAVRDRQWQVEACSAKTGDGLERAMEWAIKTIQA